ncbi:hypothetical protein BD310DRAFT_647813 [Dichomitus squalens]|uniref:Uncharacterized protein n=1 Tax=Dichomitus squalens TaxID=114155 RepID=A0A4Q9PP62_9APHY|nr:hypothetical protein BD310DRAFT_647813 [Dichomitus squalens]
MVYVTVHTSSLCSILCIVCGAGNTGGRYTRTDITIREQGTIPLTGAAFTRHVSRSASSTRGHIRGIPAGSARGLVA